MGDNAMASSAATEPLRSSVVLVGIIRSFGDAQLARKRRVARVDRSTAYRIVVLVGLAAVLEWPDRVAGVPSMFNGVVAANVAGSSHCTATDDWPAAPPRWFNRAVAMVASKSSPRGQIAFAQHLMDGRQILPRRRLRRDLHTMQ